MIHDEIDGHERLDLRGDGPAGHGGVAHRGDIDQERHPGKVLQDDAGDGEGDLVFAGSLRVPVGEVVDIGLAHLASVDVAQHRFEHDADADGEPAQVFRHTGLGEGGQGVKFALGSGTGGEGADDVKTHLFQVLG